MSLNRIISRSFKDTTRVMGCLVSLAHIIVGGDADGDFVPYVSIQCCLATIECELLRRRISYRASISIELLGIAVSIVSEDVADS